MSGAHPESEGGRSGAGDLIVRAFPVGWLQCNCYVIACPESREAIVLDPGDEPERVLEELRKLGYRVKAIVHTHAHFDHVGGTPQLARATDAEIRLHEADLPLYELAPRQPEFFGLPPGREPMPEITRFLEDEEEIRIGPHTARILHTPGHSPGSVCVELGPYLFSGDTLFHGSVGRTDLWGGSQRALLRSIRERLWRLDDDTLVLPGHGDPTRIGIEKRTNPFVGG